MTPETRRPRPQPAGRSVRILAAAGGSGGVQLQRGLRRERGAAGGHGARRLDDVATLFAQATEVVVIGPIRV